MLSTPVTQHLNINLAFPVVKGVRGAWAEVPSEASSAPGQPRLGHGRTTASSSASSISGPAAAPREGDGCTGPGLRWQLEEKASQHINAF